MVKPFFLSPNTLNLFLECPRCFWFHLIKGEGFRRPEPPTSTLPRKMDSLIKDHFDLYRKKGLLPPELKESVEGVLVEQDLIKKWRFWKTGLRFIDKDGHQLSGALDECILDKDRYIPLDYKTRGSDLREDSSSYYIFQMSCYNFLLSKNNYPVSNFAYLVYYILTDLKEQGEARFNIEVRRIETLPPDKVYDIFREAIDTLLGKLPSPAKDCAFCKWVDNLHNVDKEQLSLF